MKDDTPTAVADTPHPPETPGLTPEGTPEAAAPPAPAPGLFARFRAVCRKKAATTAFFVLLAVYSLAGTVIMIDSDLLTWTGVVAFVISILARRWLHENHTDVAQVLKLLGDLAAVTLIAAIVRDTFAGHLVIKCVAYGLTAVFCWVAANVFARELTGTPDSQ